MAGYSGKPLWKKLGVKDAMSVALIDPPDNAETLLAGRPIDVTLRRGAQGSPDLSLLFVRKPARLERRVQTIWRLAFPDRAVWVCWPKKSSTYFAGLTEDGIREAVLPKGLVDVKVCAVDDNWWGLKLAVRKELRDSTDKKG